MTYIKAPEISARTIGDEVFILDRKSSVIHTFNATGAHLWHAVAAGKTFDDTCAELCAAFEVAPNQAREDVAAFIENLTKNNLIVPAETEQAS